MFWSKNLPVDSERFLLKRSGFGIVAHGVIQPGQVTEVGRRVGMFRAQDILSDSERFLRLQWARLFDDHRRACDQVSLDTIPPCASKG
jgi:hypothetical protein